MDQKIIPPEDRIPSRIYRVKIKETRFKRLAEEENIYVLEKDDFESAKYKPYSITEKEDETLPPLKFIVDKVYFQRIDDDPASILVTAYIDYGYLKPNAVKELVDVNKRKPFWSEPKGKCVVRLFNDDFCELAEIPMKHSSEFTFHPVSGAPQLFLGLVEQLEEQQKYFYRVECFDENNEIIGASKLTKFVSGVQSPKKPIFYVSVSDLHGGSKAKFKRGKARGLRVKNNPRLVDLMDDIDFYDDVYTFDQNYQLITTSGDNIDNGSYHEYWADLFASSARNFARFPIFPTIGNHDYYNGGIGRGSMLGGRKRTQKHFHMFVQTPRKNGGAFYSHTEGNVLMIHLDSIGLTWGNESITCESRQWEWLNKELKKWNENKKKGKGPQFCVVFLHSAIFSLGFFGRARNNSDAKAQSCLTPLLDNYGVNAVVFGHDHLYQRSKWNDTSYMCIGVSGKTPINLYDRLIGKTKYKIDRAIEGEGVRGYGVTYVPPNMKEMKEKEKKEFIDWLFTIKTTIVESDLIEYYWFEEGKDSPLYKELMTDISKKEKFVEEEIIEKMKTNILWRYFALDGTLLDHEFLPITPVKDEDKLKIACPAEHLR